MLVTGAIKSGGLDWGKHRVCEELTVNSQEINIRLRSEQFLKSNIQLATDQQKSEFLKSNIQLATDQQKSEYYSVAVN